MGRGLGARHIGFGTVISMSSRDNGCPSQLGKISCYIYISNSLTLPDPLKLT